MLVILFPSHDISSRKTSMGPDAFCQDGNEGRRLHVQIWDKKLMIAMSREFASEDDAT